MTPQKIIWRVYSIRCPKLCPKLTKNVKALRLSYPVWLERGIIWQKCESIAIELARLA